MYEIKLRKNGKITGKRGPYTTKAAAARAAQPIADAHPTGTVSVEPVRKKPTKRANGPRVPKGWEYDYARSGTYKNADGWFMEKIKPGLWWLYSPNGSKVGGAYKTPFKAAADAGKVNHYADGKPVRTRKNPKKTLITIYVSGNEAHESAQRVGQRAVRSDYPAKNLRARLKQGFGLTAAQATKAIDITKRGKPAVITITGTRVSVATQRRNPVPFLAAGGRAAMYAASTPQGQKAISWSIDKALKHLAARTGVPQIAQIQDLVMKWSGKRPTKGAVRTAAKKAGVTVKA